VCLLRSGTVRQLSSALAAKESTVHVCIIYEMERASLTLV
jgi:hypothetical protein